MTHVSCSIENKRKTRENGAGPSKINEKTRENGEGARPRRPEISSFIEELGPEGPPILAPGGGAQSFVSTWRGRAC